MLALRYRRFWIFASGVLLAIVVWGSLQTAIRHDTLQGFDKFQHFGTYMFLSLWFTGLYRRVRYGAIAAALLGLGLCMELAQFAMQAGRFGDPYDMAANGAGVGAGMLLAWLLTGGWAGRIETWIAR